MNGQQLTSAMIVATLTVLLACASSTAVQTQAQSIDRYQPDGSRVEETRNPNGSITRRRHPAPPGFMSWPKIHRAVYTGDAMLMVEAINEGGEADYEKRVDIGRASYERSYTALLLAAHNKHYLFATGLVDSGADVHARTALGTTALHYAAQGSLDLVRKLVERGANVNDGIERKWTPLMHAAEAGQADIAAFLIAEGANASVVNPDGFHALQIAAGGNHGDVARVIAPEFNADARLCAFAQVGDEAAVVRQLADGANVDAVCRRRYGFTPLMMACSAGRADQARLLVERGATINIEPSPGYTPWTAAAGNGLVGVLQLFHERAPNARFLEGTLSVAAQDGQVAALIFALDRGANVNAKETNGMTALHRAAQHMAPSAVELLLERGAMPDSRDNFQGTPMLYAAMGRKAEAVTVIRMLLAAGADPLARDRSGRTPLSEAKRNNEDSARLLESHGSQ